MPIKRIGHIVQDNDFDLLENQLRDLAFRIPDVRIVDAVPTGNAPNGSMRLVVTGGDNFLYVKFPSGWINITSTGAVGMADSIDDGDPVDTNTQGQLILGSDAVPGNAKVIRTDTDGHIQSDILSSALPAGAATETTLTDVDTSLDNIEDGYASEGSALGSGVLIQGDDGTDRHNVQVDSSGNLISVGNVAHDAADSGDPVSIGGHAYDDDDTGDISQVDLDDRVRAGFDRQGRLLTRPKRDAHEIELSGLDGNYNGATMERNSADIDGTLQALCTYQFTLDFTGSSGTQTIEIFVEVKDESGNYRWVRNDYLGKWIYDDVYASSTKEIALIFPCPWETFRITIISTDTTSSKYFTISDSSVIVAT